MESTETIQNAQLIVFRLGGEEYGLSIEQIKEVVPTPHITHVPLAPDYVLGVANIRGNVMAIINLEKKLDLQNSNSQTDLHPPYCLVIDSKDLHIALTSFEVPNTLTVYEAQIDRSPSVAEEENINKDYITGVARLEDRMVILIDIFKII